MIQKLNVKSILSSILILGLLILGYFEYDLSLLKLSYGDAPYYFFNLITTKSFFLPHDRYSAVFYEYLPLLGIWLKCSYHNVFYLFSINSYVSSLILLSFYYYQTRDLSGTTILTLSMIYGMANSYFYYVPEHFHFFLSFFLVFYLNYLIKNQSKYIPIVLTIIIILLNGSHLYALILFLIGMMYLIFDDKKNRTRFVLVSSIIFIGLLICKLIFPLKEYESQKMSYLVSNLIHIHTLDKAAYSYYVKMCFDNFTYVYLPIIFLSMYSIYLKKYYAVFFIIIFYFGLYYLNCLYFYNWDSSAYMNLYGRVAYLSILFPAFILFQKNDFNYLPILFFTLYLGICSHKEIDRFNKEYTIRYNYLKHLTQLKELNTKVSVNIKDVNPKKILVTWSTPYESLVLSTFFNNSKSLWINDLSKSEINKLDSNLIYSNFNSFQINQLNSTYFHSIKKEPYAVLDYYID